MIYSDDENLLDLVEVDYLDPDVVELIADTPPQRKKQKKIAPVDPSEKQACKDTKILIAKEVELEEAIWNPQDKLHSNIHAIIASWNRISKTVKCSGKKMYNKSL